MRIALSAPDLKLGRQGVGHIVRFGSPGPQKPDWVGTLRIGGHDYRVEGWSDGKHPGKGYISLRVEEIVTGVSRR